MIAEQQDPVADYLKARAAARTASQSAPSSDPVAEYLAAKKATPRPNKFHAEYKAGTLAPRIASENAQEKATDPTIGTELFGTAASLARDIPGAEALQAATAAGASHIPGLRPEGGPIDYRTALGQIHDVEDQAGALGTAARLAGGGLATAVIPGSAITKGAVYGGLHGFTDADPDADRRAETVQQAVMGGVLGAGAEVAGAVNSRVGSLIKGQAKKESDVVSAIRSFFQKKNATQGARVNAAPNRGTPVSLGPVPLRYTAGPTVPPQLPKLTLLDPPVEPPASLAESASLAPPDPAPTQSPSIDARMQAMIDKLRASRGAVRGPSPRGDEWTDAELAQGLDKPSQDLEELLRRSLEMKGVKPVVPRSP